MGNRSGPMMLFVPRRHRVSDLIVSYTMWKEPTCLLHACQSCPAAGDELEGEVYGECHAVQNMAWAVVTQSRSAHHWIHLSCLSRPSRLTGLAPGTTLYQPGRA